MNCPHCGKRINVGALIGSVSTPAKAASSRANGALGGRPKTKRKHLRTTPETPAVHVGDIELIQRLKEAAK